MTSTTSNGYIVTDNELIQGFGATADAAWADALSTLRDAGVAILTDEEDSTDQMGSWTRAGNLILRPASAALIQDVTDRGGAIGWDVRDGIAITHDEMDAE